MNIIVKVIAAALAVSVPAVPAIAAQDAPDQPAGPIALSGDVKAVETNRDAEGNATTRLVEPDLIVPGDRLVFGTEFANISSEPVENFVVTNPLPAAVRLAPDADPALTVSVDGGKNWGTLASLSVAEDDGTTRSATHEDVTHVRWTLAEIAAGEAGRLEYPAIIR
ncbi:hypothetical protein [Qipengyuania nanhaisediminis]|uniref:hypothetical protein n=1 Tax=Qipengyuania nanhaisediminis TaxID=604088 RepID=UPI0038B40266